MTHDELAAAIAAECDRLDIVVPVATLPRLAAYAASLWSWNERLNLTRHTDVGKFVSRDIADAVAIAAHLANGERVLDVGTGGGVPGVLLAVLRPDLRVELAESVGKRARAVTEILGEIGLDVPMHEGAAQTLVASRASGAARFDTLVVRADTNTSLTNADLLISGSGLIIIVGVVMDLIRQVNAQMLAHDYDKLI